MRHKINNKNTFWLLLGLVCITFVFSIGFGVSIVDHNAVWQCLTSECEQEIYKTILLDIRLPRVLLGFLAGFGLAISGELRET